jgi:DNA modification methylase
MTTLPRGVVYTARAEEVYPTLEPGSVSMVWSDGPYGIRIAEWDRTKPADLPAWYEPHIREWGRICAPSATIYHWGTSEGEGYVREVYRRHGWTFRATVIWHKPDSPSLIGSAVAKTWLDLTEVCGIWTRGAPDFSAPDGAGNVWTYAVKALGYERAAGIGEAVKPKQRLLKSGRVRLPAIPPAHPCQKPLTYVRRAILASTRPDSVILDPYAGTCRVALVCEQLHENEARHHISIEMDPTHVEAALKDIDIRTRQHPLF